MKKAYILVLILFCLGMLTLTSCQGQKAGQVPTLVWYFNTLFPEPVDLAENARIMSDYTQEKIGVRFELRPIDMDDRIRAVINSGAPFDIICVQAAQYAEYVPQGLFADITDALGAQTPALRDFVPQSLWDGVKVKGKIYAVPAYKDSAGTIFAFIDERYVRKYNIDITKNTLADFDKAFYAMKAGEGPDFYPCVMWKNAGWPFPASLVEYDDLGAGLGTIMGVRVDDESRRVVSVLEEPEIMERLRVFRRWYQDGIINPDAPQLTEDPLGRPVMYDYAWPSKAQTLEKMEGVERYIPIQLNTPVISTFNTRGSLLALGAKSKYVNESLKLIELINTDHKFRDMLAYGIEGKHFEYVSYNVIHRLTNTYLTHTWAQGTFFNLSTADDQPPTTWDEVRRQNEAGVPSVLNGFAMDISSLQDEYAACIALIERYIPDILLGLHDPDEAVPRFMAELRAAGFDRIIAEARRQVDEAYPK